MLCPAVLAGFEAAAIKAGQSASDFVGNESVVSRGDEGFCYAISDPFPSLSALCSWIECGKSKGLPDVPPMIRTCLSASLLYFCCCAISDVRIDVSE